MCAALARACPVCSAAEPAAYLEKPGLRLVQCARCGMVYVPEVPEEYASGRCYEDIGRDYYLSADKLESDYAAVRFERELRLFRRYCRSGRVLDVGCSSGAFLWQLGRRFPGAYELLGTDASGPALDYAASRGVSVVRGDFLAQSFDNRQFDAVTLWAVLEHLAAPAAFLEKAWSLLKPGGLCFALVPNLGALAARLLGSHYRYIYAQHLNYFTRATLARLCAPRFVPIQFRSMHFNPIVIWQDWLRGGAEVTNSERGRLLKRTTSYKQNPWLLPMRFLYRLTEGGLSRFNLADNLTVVLRRKG